MLHNYGEIRSVEENGQQLFPQQFVRLNHNIALDCVRGGFKKCFVVIASSDCGIKNFAKPFDALALRAVFLHFV